MAATNTRSGFTRRLWICSILGAVWILFATWASHLFVPDRQPLLQTLVEVLVVGVTFGVLYWLLKTEFRRTERAQEQLRISQEQLAAVLEGSNDGLWDWRIVTGEVFLNRRWAEMLGYSLEEAPKQVRFWRELIHPEDRARADEALKAHLGGHSAAYECELRLRTKSGAYKWILDRGKVVARDEAGKPLRVAGTHSDIMDRKQAEEALRQGEEKYRTLVKHLPQRLFTKDREGVYTSASENFAADLGLSVDEIIGKTDFQVCPRELAEKYRRDDHEVTTSGQLREVEEPYEAQGERRWAHVVKVPYRDAEGSCVGVLGIFSDITARKRAEEAMLLSETRLRLVWESALDAMRLSDRQGRVVRVNDAYCRLVGKSRDELEGRPISAPFLKSLAPEILREHEDQIHKGGTTTAFESESTLADGRRLHLEVSYSLLKLPGHPDLALTVLRDITARKLAEQALRAGEEHYRTVLEAVTDALFVHELKDDGTPGRFVEVNDVACARLGYSREQLLQMTPGAISPPGIEGDTARIGKQLQAGLTPRYERVHLAKDGRRIPVEVHARLFQFGGRPAVISVVRDITERKRAEEALGASEARLIDALQIARLGHWEYELRRDLVLSSDQVYALLNTTAQKEGGYELSRADFLRRFIHPEDAHVFGEQLERALANPDNQTQAQPRELRLVQREGEVRWCAVRLKVTNAGSGQDLKVAGSFQDITEQQRAEERLQRQNDFNQAINRRAPAGICVYHELKDAPFIDFTVWNDRMTQITGYTLEEIKQRGWYDRLFPEDPDRQALARKRMREMASGQDVIEQEWEIVRADGEKRIVSLSSSLLPPAGGVRQVLAVVQDITERKADEKDLRLQKSALEAAANGIVITDRKGTIIWVNDAFTTLTGYSRWEVIGQNTRLLKSNKHDAQFYRGMWEAIEAGSVWRGELENKRKDGSFYDEEMAITPVRDASGQIAHYIAIKQDISQRRQFERKLEEQAGLLDLAGDAIYVRAHDGSVRYWNRGAERLYGWSPGEVKKRPVAELIHGSDQSRDAFRKANELLLETGYWEGELTQTRKDGTEVTVFCRWTLVPHAIGAQREVLCINSDITERKTLASQLQRAQRMESIGNLASGIAHDLNNILTPILMAPQMLRTPTLDEGRLKLLERIENSARRGADIVRRLLTFARGAPKVEHTPIHPRRLMEDVGRLLMDILPKHIHLRIEVPEGVPLVLRGAKPKVQVDMPLFLGDTTQLQQVLLNLCVNARDAIDDWKAASQTNGVHANAQDEVSVLVEELTAEESQELGYRGKEPGPFVVFKVKDNGCGMPPDVREHIFEPFFTTKPKDKGTGLGLAVVHGIIESHRGYIHVKSETGGEDHGTTFLIFLPVHASQVESDRAEAIASAGDLPAGLLAGRNELILVVDDEADLRNTVCTLLKQNGYRVEDAEDGDEAVRRILSSQGKITAALVDVQMPKRDGVATVDSLLNQCPKLKVVVMTGMYANESQESQFRRLGVRHFLNKPLENDSLLRMLRDAIDGSIPDQPAKPN